MRGGNNNNQPGIFLEAQLNPHNQASFIEYLRWLRIPNLGNDDNATKAKLLQNAAKRSNNYSDYFQRRNKATKLIAEGNTFTVECEWRIRVGGMRGPEDMLIPAFDAAGMPYISSSTLRGVARAQGVRSIVEEKLAELQQMQSNITDRQRQDAIQEAEKEIARYFGSLEATEENRAGKVMFLDAYPCGKSWVSNERGLAVDIANNIWKWNENSPIYQPNPNLFISLRKPKFVIGLRPTSQCDDATFQRVKTWLEQGLQAGIGSQVNSGYGEINVEGIAPPSPFLQVNFTLTGQLIHSHQRMNWNEEKNRYEGQAEAEVRAIAFKSMLRYWFRSLCLGVLPVAEVRDRLEPKLFGAIKPQTQGWIKCQVQETAKPNPRAKEQNQNACLSESGILKLSFSTEAPAERQDAIRQLFQNLTWLMFHLGGVGQGSRRPKHSRNSKPFYRGTQLRATNVSPNSNNDWDLPETPLQFKSQFQTKMRGFYRALAQLTATTFNPHSPRQNIDGFIESIGRDCKIVVCQGNSNSQTKSFTLNVLHELARNNNGNYDRDLCGDANSNPSPIWIADLGNYQVVTVFGADNRKRSNFLTELSKRATACETLWDKNGINLNPS
ncbi:MAG: type III-B CRISPR module RAMP protein Cmr6 [Oscillatoriales cyanobacterium]|uniref:type III-B CRISPR module RAMP protein Cmr6 n=1 Tax=unclassified Microcoleus TaxID=2642155 RepID=UPI001DF6E6EE|nr:MULTISPECIES: type III-B CRISPR module RAMP protein Cmr6 [unclassified Microcoleus]TAE09448.1 MAG: type III-B CRISPR module RAMP protein Cmr6 [Oscillatoriales cyanobacterium]MCC3568079.1 type III-B CRISPR module RAMP protein Cmr6 [Microcoleus sp. PH2017_31_RDM_U_A]MCC3580358.1 type III-B CRISPR module RAMP protein Cmr6 [Microcoleus sp. PH2017_32_RDM_D_A]MCC3618514.1 type III-B CRISPR module RAMP protein Cmr6 [Microcoleus sp. PH2017_38_RDM_U_B]TAE19072.1 MAG: type III-B CRISPR module RAMP pr